MLELMFCSLLTVFPDYLFRRFAQGKRWGREITFFTMWYELRWGITACVMLTVTLITIVFYYHPSTKDVSSFFRTVTILPEAPGRVVDVYVENYDFVKAGDPIFKLDDLDQRAALAGAEERITEVEGAMAVAEFDLVSAEGAVRQARGSYQTALDELESKQELMDRNANVVAEQEIIRLTNIVETRQGALDAAEAGLKAVQKRLDAVLPAQKANAEAERDRAKIALEKRTVYALIDGQVEQFALAKGDYINPILRPAGILVPDESGHTFLQAGFGQTNAQVLKPGMVGEVTCVSKPFTILPMVVTKVQDVIPAGQFRPTDRLLDIQDRARPGTVTVQMEPLYPGLLDDIPPGSKCIANAYSSFHDRLAEADIGTGEFVFLHVVDTVALVHALILRIQALLLPVQTLVFTGH